jgi:Zn finger protein HypA/HybF involved in hydrogenase expression
MSIALEVGQLAAARIEPGQASQIVRVGIEVGDDAGVEIENLAFWLEAVLATPPFRAARPVIARCPGDVLRLAYVEVDDDRPDA